jgi:hypothetical protein
MKNIPFARKVELYEAIKNIFVAVFAEIQGMAKKKPEATLSKTKITQLNRILEDIKLIMADSPEAKYLDLLDDDILPQFSDALLILAHYDGALKNFYDKHWKFVNHDWQWSER